MFTTVTNDATHGTIIFGDSRSNTTQPVSIQKSNIVKVGSYWSQNCYNGLGQTPYGYGVRTPGRTTKTIVILEMVDKTKISFDCDEIENQATWQGCTFAALGTALTDINSWL